MQATLDIPEIDVAVTVSRNDFETMIELQLQQFKKAVDDTLNSSQLLPANIDLVIRTGGSSQIPAVKQILEQYFPGRVIEHDAFTSVAAGLAIADFNNLGHSQA
jgi:hypothetical chaperone protein